MARRYPGFSAHLMHRGHPGVIVRNRPPVAQGVVEIESERGKNSRPTHRDEAAMNGAQSSPFSEFKRVAGLVADLSKPSSRSEEGGFRRWGCSWLWLGLAQWVNCAARQAALWDFAYLAPRAWVERSLAGHASASSMSAASSIQNRQGAPWLRDTARRR